VLRDDAGCRACALLGHGLNASEQASAASPALVALGMSD
jgi:hypothetical protein